MKIHIAEATEQDVPVILDLIRRLAEYERLADKVTATEDELRRTLFGAHPAAEALLAAVEGETVGYALFFNYLLDLPGQTRTLSRGPVCEI